MARAFGIVNTSGNHIWVEGMQDYRPIGAFSFLGRYRIVDFALSNLVHAGVDNVGILAQKNYQSLMDHLGSGKDWDLSRKNGGLVIFPPFGSYKSDVAFTSRLEALISIKGFIEKHKRFNSWRKCWQYELRRYSVLPTRT